MEKEFLPYNLALELKELGFKEECFGFYESLKKIGDSYCFNNYSMWDGISQNISESDDYHLYITLNELYGYYDNILRAPTWQQAFDWFREKYYMEGHPHISYNLPPKATWGYSIQTSEPKHIKSLNSHYSTYEEARQACLEKLIEIAKEQNVK